MEAHEYCDGLPMPRNCIDILCHTIDQEIMYTIDDNDDNRTETEQSWYTCSFV